MEDVLIPLIVFGTFFGVMYVFFTTRNKERLALIEKGAEASLFNTGSKGNWMKGVLSIGLLAIGIGAGVLLGALLEMGGMDDDMAYSSMIFVCGGLGLVAGFFLIRKLDKD
jgi:formate-dependent nitrite reductase membrane component NrfD